MHEAIGKTQTVSDPLDPARAAALHATLSRPGPAPGVGDALPAFWHQIYFWQALPPQDLGRDGHPRLGGGLIPDLGLPQRMWAGGRLRFHHPLRLGRPAERRTTVIDVTAKRGKSGRLGFVTLGHEIRQDGVLCVEEDQDLVYRPPPADRGAAAAAPQAPDDAILTEEAAFSATLLFRYSALTFNGHRIHYDLDYCRRVEGYGGLVVHGPLLAQLLVHLAERRDGPLAEFRFRATAPLVHVETATLCAGRGDRLWVRGPGGRQCMTAHARGRAVTDL